MPFGFNLPRMPIGGYGKADPLDQAKNIDLLYTGGLGALLAKRLGGNRLSFNEAMAFSTPMVGMPRPYLARIPPPGKRGIDLSKFKDRLGRPMMKEGTKEYYKFTGENQIAEDSLWGNLNEYDDEAWNLIDELGQPIGTIMHSRPNASTAFGPSSDIYVSEAYIQPEHRNLKNFQRLTQRIRRTGIPLSASFANDDLRRAYVLAAERGLIKADPETIAAQRSVMERAGPSMRQQERMERRASIKRNQAKTAPKGSPDRRMADMWDDPRIAQFHPETVGPSATQMGRQRYGRSQHEAITDAIGMENARRSVHDPAARQRLMERDPRLRGFAASQGGLNVSALRETQRASIFGSLAAAARRAELERQRQPFVNEEAIQAWRRGQTPRGSIHPAVARLRTPRARRAQERHRHER